MRLVIEFIGRLIVFAVTLFLLLEFIVTCEMDTWKAGLIFGSVTLLILVVFFVTKQYKLVRCPSCCHRILPAKS